MGIWLYVYTLEAVCNIKGMYVIYCNPHGGDGYGEKFLEMVERWGMLTMSILWNL